MSSRLALLPSAICCCQKHFACDRQPRWSNTGCLKRCPFLQCMFGERRLKVIMSLTCVTWQRRKKVCVHYSWYQFTHFNGEGASIHMMDKACLKKTCVQNTVKHTMWVMCFSFSVWRIWRTIGCLSFLPLHKQPHYLFLNTICLFWSLFLIVPKNKSIKKLENSFSSIPQSSSVFEIFWENEKR